MLRIGLATLAVALMFASSATGQHREGIYDVEGGFLTLAGFNAFEQFDNSGPVSVDNSLGFSLSGGYRLHPRLSGELNWSLISGWELRGVPDPAAPRLQVEGGTFTGDVKGYALTGRIQPYAQVGIGLMYARLATVKASCVGWWYCTRIGTDSEVEFAARLGGGVDYWVNPEWALMLSALYVIPTGALSDLQYLQLTWGFVHPF